MRPGQRPDRAALRVAQRLPPAVLQRQHAHRSGRRPSSAAASGAGPAGAVAAAAGVLRADVGAGRHRARGVAGLPVVRHPRRGHAQDLGREAVHPDARKQEEAVVADHAPDVRGAGLGGPSDPSVPRRQLPGRRAEADPAEDAAALRADPAAQLAAGGPRPSQRMVRLHHRLPQPPVAGAVHRVERDGAEIPQAAGQPGVGNVADRDRGRGGRVGNVARRRKLQPEALRQNRQRLRRRRQAQAARGVAPARPLAQLAA